MEEVLTGAGGWIGNFENVLKTEFFCQIGSPNECDLTSSGTIRYVPIIADAGLFGTQWFDGSASTLGSAIIEVLPDPFPFYSKLDSAARGVCNIGEAEKNVAGGGNLTIGMQTSAGAVDPSASALCP